MQKLIIRYSIYAALTLIAFGLFNFTVLNKMSYEVQEIAGYLSIFISMIFVFMGIKQYRDQVNGGKLSFAQGLKVGTLIVLIPELINPAWKEQYYNHYLEQYKSLPAAEYEKMRSQLKAQQEMFSLPILQFIIMSLTVFVLGMIVTVISSLTLKKS
jgi:Protein of unknown function (DUF4199)